MKHTQNNEAVYAAHGCKDRNGYLNSLADDRGIDPIAVGMIADILGPSEDFDGLVTELDDFDWETDGFE